MTTRTPTGSHCQATDQFRFLWILYSDANSRFNTLIEECAHLQDTILSLTSSPELLDEIVGDTKTSDEVRGFTRPVACRPKHHPKYYTVPVRDRALLSLWTLLGGLIVALDKNQRQHEASFEAAVEKLWKSGQRGDHLYWYIATRGYFLTAGFKHYTSQLEHAHEKLIQMLENQPGTLPNPILMRRWNSGMYGEFLSEYSRHVNWEAQKLINLIAKSPTEGKEKDQSITHTWTHQPTSMEQHFEVNLKASSKGTSGRYRFASIRSAYFYMEQPVLLPLLYHECAHISFPDHPVPDHKDFFGAKKAAVQSLRLMKFPDAPEKHQYENFWEHFTEEVWADALSIALGGRGYLSALAMQLFGLSGPDNFEHYDVAADMLVAPDEFGQFSKRQHPIPYPTLDQSFFWEARLLIACKLLKRRADVYKAESKRSPHEFEYQPQDVELANAIEQLIAASFESGNEAFSHDGTSRRHEELWKYRRELNTWVVKTIGTYLDKPFDRAAEWSPVCSTYELSEEAVRGCIESVVNGYRFKYMPGAVERGGGLSLSKRQRIEDLSIDIRWQLAADVCIAINRRQEDLSLWTCNFANWMRHDGGAPFRIALEASRLKLSLLDAIADGLSEPLPSELDEAARRLKNLPPTIQSSDIWRRLTSPAGGSHWDYLNKDERLVTDLFRRRGVTNSKRFQFDYEQQRPYMRETEAIVNSAMEKLAKYFANGSQKENSSAGSAEAWVGTLTLGVIRPDIFGRAESDSSPYLFGLAQAEGLFKHAFEEHRKLAENSGDREYLAQRSALGFGFCRLLGEYQFLSYLKGSTPVERDFHPSHQCAEKCDAEGAEGYTGSRHLLKPRMVLQVGGKELTEAIQDNASSKWGRVALIRFKYRWQWIDLMQRLEKMNTLKVNDYALLLSSAWEDVVLVTWHEKPESLWDHRNLGLKPGTEYGVDIQSAYFVPTSTTKLSVSKDLASHDIDGPSELFMRWVESSEHVGKVYTRSGRFDYTVVWKMGDEKGTESLDHCAKGLAEIPKEVWLQISSMITSYEQLSWKPNITDADRQKCKAVTHFAIKNRLNGRRSEGQVATEDQR